MAIEAVEEVDNSRIIVNLTVVPTVARQARQPASQKVDLAFHESLGWIQLSPIRLFETFLFLVC